MNDASQSRMKAIGKATVFAGVFCLFVGVSNTCLAGSLDQFETEATEEKRPEEEEEESGVGETLLGAWFDFLSEGASDIFSAIFARGGGASAARLRPEGSSGGSAGSYSIAAREPGDASLPFLRVDTFYMNAKSDVTAWDARVEAGWGPVGGQFRHSRFSEEEPKDRLLLDEYHLLYRMSFGNTFSMDLGGGILSLRGNNTHSGFSFTWPIAYRPTKSLALFLRPSHGFIGKNVIDNFDLGATISLRFFSFSGGYRWLKSDDATLRGPFVGISIHY